MRDFYKVYFVKDGDTPPVSRTVTGDQIVTWNTEKMAIAAKQTTPLPVVWLSDLYTTVPMVTVRAAIVQDMREMPADDYLKEDDW